MFWKFDPATKSGEMLVKIPASGKNADRCLLLSDTWIEIAPTLKRELYD